MFMESVCGVPVGVVIVLNVCLFYIFLLNVLPFLHDLLNLCAGSL